MKKRSKAVFPAGNVSSKRTNQLSEGTFLTPKYTSVDNGISRCSACEVDHPPDLNDPPVIYRMKKVTRITGLSRSSVYRLEALDLFPKRVKLRCLSRWLAQQ
jgi:predicted DNA-binding transcriptional regulator AlpA